MWSEESQCTHVLCGCMSKCVEIEIYSRNWMPHRIAIPVAVTSGWSTTESLIFFQHVLITDCDLCSCGNQLSSNIQILVCGTVPLECVQEKTLEFNLDFLSHTNGGWL